MLLYICNLLLFLFLGWLKTVEEYFFDSTQKILDYMYKELSSKNDLKFIYAEMIFFELWWSGLTDEVRNIVKGFFLYIFVLINFLFLLKNEANKGRSQAF